MDWLNEIEKRKVQLIKDTQELLKIKSVLNEEDKGEGAPFGQGIKEALDFTLAKCKEYGMEVKNIDGYAGHAEVGQGEELLGILCHLDVVPEGDGWTYPPYEANIVNGRLYARGAIDDKGPTMAAIHALRLIKELDLKLNRRVRIIFGTDEESGWADLDYYFKKEEMPTFGFAPDADFPIIVTEKGIANIFFTGTVAAFNNNKANIISFSAGRRVNMVPDHALTVVEGSLEVLNKIKEQYEKLLTEYKWGGTASLTNNQLQLTLNGISAHGMEPFKGVNAGLELVHLLKSLTDWLNIEEWMNWVEKYLYQDFSGKNLEIDYIDDISGELTVNAGIINVENGNVLIKLNIRYPVTASFAEILSKLEKKGNEAELNIDYNDTPPHHVDKEHFLVKTLKKVYEEQTGNEATLLAIGGGTYARALETGVAFGPLFPGKVETAHQKDEHIEVEDLIKSAALYAQAIYELAK